MKDENLEAVKKIIKQSSLTKSEKELMLQIAEAAFAAGRLAERKLTQKK